MGRLICDAVRVRNLRMHPFLEHELHGRVTFLLPPGRMESNQRKKRPARRKRAGANTALWWGAPEKKGGTNKESRPAGTARLRGRAQARGAVAFPSAGKKCPQADCSAVLRTGVRERGVRLRRNFTPRKRLRMWRKKESPAEPGPIRRASRVRMRNNIRGINFCI